MGVGVIDSPAGDHRGVIVRARFQQNVWREWAKQAKKCTHAWILEQFQSS